MLTGMETSYMNHRSIRCVCISVRVYLCATVSVSISKSLFFFLQKETRRMEERIGEKRNYS